MRVRLSGNLLRFTDLQNRLEIDGATVGAVIANLVAEYPQIESVLLDRDGHMRRVHRLALNDDVLVSFDVDMPVEATDELSVLTAIAGG